jgi:hypothetical protein
MNWKGFGTGNLLIKKILQKNYEQPFTAKNSDQDLNQAPPAYESEALLLHHPAPVVSCITQK